MTRKGKHNNIQDSSIKLDDVLECRDIVFSPNQVYSDKFNNPHIYKGFMAAGRQSDSETCKKTAKPGDLYLFYFGKPESKIVGLGVCRQSPEPKAWKKMFFCPFDGLYHCLTPVTSDELQSNVVLASWWKTKPYRGRPKTIPANAASALLQIIAKREPSVSALLNDYIYESGILTTDSPKIALMDALEGTQFERLVKRQVRSQELRAEKIRLSMQANDGHLICEVPGCGFDFVKSYGQLLGHGFAHVHHLQSLAKRKEGRTSLNDLAIVCANCHAMIHRGRQCRPLQGLIQSK